MKNLYYGIYILLEINPIIQIVINATISFQNGGEVKSFEVHRINNDNNDIVNVWALPNPSETEWQQGRLEVLSEGDREYQVFSMPLVENVLIHYNIRKIPVM